MMIYIKPMENKIEKKSKIWSKTNQIAIKNQWLNLKDKKIKEVKTKKNIILGCKHVLFYFLFKKKTNVIWGKIA